MRARRRDDAAQANTIARGIIAALGDDQPEVWELRRQLAEDLAG